MTALILKYTKDKVGEKSREEAEQEAQDKEDAKQQVFDAIRNTVCGQGNDEDILDIEDEEE